ncbi:MAG: hypothetical protein H6828_15820 [Planctomycetes bacterium]|nr:hypothetical protein [Planctomycetota bacterium]
MIHLRTDTAMLDADTFDDLTRIDIDSLFDRLMEGGPLMVPIALCSVVALAYTVERLVRLGGRALGDRRLARELTERMRAGGADAARSRAAARWTSR